MENAPKADLHTPDELLTGARALANANDPHFNRGAILEAITALEAYVSQTVFEILEKTLDPLLTKWIQEKTRMDFDSRLSVLVPVATKVSIAKGDSLWDRYKKVKAIRNKVTHSGRRVTREEVEYVLDTVHDWLAHLGHTAGVDNALLALKERMDAAHDHLSRLSPREIEKWIADYFRRSTPAQVEQDVALAHPRKTSRVVDLVLQFGALRVGVEIKHARAGGASIRRIVDLAQQQALSALVTGDLDRMAIVVLARDELLDPALFVGGDGRVSLLMVGRPATRRQS